MTGKSLIWKMNSEERSDFIKYQKKLISASMILVGSFLLLEHLFVYEGFDLLDFWGHESLGIGMIIIAILLSTEWNQWKSLNLKDIRNWIR